MAVAQSSSTNHGFFLTFEGLDGSGKTTQILRLTTWLYNLGLDPVNTRQPGGTPTGDRIRALLLDSKSANLAPHTELAMMFADRAQSIQEIIAPALAEGRIVVCDRFTDSTEAYQGGGRQLGSQIVLDLHRIICGNLQPDLTILLLPDLKASLARARRRNTRHTASTGHDESRFEQEADPFFSRVYDKYREIAAREPHRVVAIEGDLDVEEVFIEVTKAVAQRLQAANRIKSKS
jgi:dTMP kinase